MSLFHGTGRRDGCHVELAGEGDPAQYLAEVDVENAHFVVFLTMAEPHGRTARPQA